MSRIERHREWGGTRKARIIEKENVIAFCFEPIWMTRKEIPNLQRIKENNARRLV